MSGMMARILVVSLSVALAFGLDGNDAKNRPVTKVVNLLKEMAKQLQEEAEQDEEIYDKMACWCTTNDKEKTQAIADAEDRLSRLTAEIEAQTATSSRLEQEIANLDAEVKENQAALDKAKAIRQKELAEFRDEEKEAIEAIRALKAAITVLSKHHKGALVQNSKLIEIVSMMRKQMLRHADLLDQVITPSQRKILGVFMQEGEDAAPHLQKYKPASGEIFGILKGMKETFEANLSSSQKEEMASAAAFEQLKTAKGEEIAAATESIKTKTAELAKSKEKLAEAKQDFEDTTASLSADQKFLIELKASCSLTDKEWEERQKARNEELAAISEAIAILTSDDARDSFTKTFNPSASASSFLQLRSRRMSAQEDARAKAAASVLLRAARALGTPKLAQLASAVKLDAFTEVKEAINGLISELEAQQEEEVAHKDECVNDIHSNTMDTDRKTREHEEAVSKIEDSEVTIQTLTEEIQALTTEIEETTLQSKRLGEDREKENAEFQQVVTDQRETLEILQSAYSRLNQFYSKKAMLLQLKSRSGGKQPAGYEGPTMDKLKPNSGASSVLGLLQNVINDAKRVQEEAVRDEADSQKAYEETLKGMNASIDAAKESIEQKEKTKADEEEALLGHQEWLSGVEEALETLATEKADNSKNCDFYLKNFDVRQKARGDEITALKEAIAILSGMK